MLAVLYNSRWKQIKLLNLDPQLLSRGERVLRPDHPECLVLDHSHLSAEASQPLQINC
jgi:hypothetical protein